MYCAASSPTPPCCLVHHSLTGGPKQHFRLCVSLDVSIPVTPCPTCSVVHPTRCVVHPILACKYTPPCCVVHHTLTGGPKQHFRLLQRILSTLMAVGGGGEAGALLAGDKATVQSQRQVSNGRGGGGREGSMARGRSWPRTRLEWQGRGTHTSLMGKGGVTATSKMPDGSADVTHPHTLAIAAWWVPVGVICQSCTLNAVPVPHPAHTSHTSTHV